MTTRASLARRVRETAELKGAFELRSGEISDTYFDKYLFESDPALLRDICNEMVALLPEETDLLAGLEMGGIPVVTVLSQITGIPAAFVRKDAKSHGTRKYAEGPSFAGRKVVIVEDVVSSGGAILAALEKLKADSVEPIGVVCVIDRETGGAENLERFGYGVQSILKAGDLNAARLQ